MNIQKAQAPYLFVFIGDERKKKFPHFVPTLYLLSRQHRFYDSPNR